MSAVVRVEDMTHAKRGRAALYRAPLQDRKGDAHYEMQLHGPTKLVESLLAEGELEFDIDPDATREDAEQRGRELMRPYLERLEQDLDEPWKSIGTGKTAVSPPTPSASKTVTLGVRRLSGKGTFWAFSYVVLPLPTGSIFQVVFPPCFAGGAVSVPLSGNPDIFIRPNSAIAPFIAASVSGAGADGTSYVLSPFAPVLPFNQFVVTAGPSSFALSCYGFGLFP